MKTYKLATLIFSLLLLLSSCEKTVENDDFLQSEWKVQSILIDSERIKVPSDNNLDKNAYVLKFDNNSFFYLPTSVNEAAGKYQILSEERIMISEYQEFTEIGNALEHQRNFDEQLLSVFNGAMSYSCTPNKLILKSEQNDEVVFIKQK